MQRSNDVKLEHRPEHNPPVRLLRARLTHIGDEVRLLVEVHGQGVTGLDQGAAFNCLWRYMDKA